MAFFASSSIEASLNIFVYPNREPLREHRKEPVGRYSQEEKVTEYEPEGKGLHEIMHLGDTDGVLMRCRIVKFSPPPLLELAAYGPVPFSCRDLMEKAQKDDPELVAEALKTCRGAHGMDRRAIGAAIALYEERTIERLEIAKRKAVAPKACAPAAGAAVRPRPRVLPAI
jgi:hypothetical protein